ncbi:MAG: cysteine hydrolase, partial [Mesorhizobium sp.]
MNYPRRRCAGPDLRLVKAASLEKTICKLRKWSIVWATPSCSNNTARRALPVASAGASGRHCLSSTWRARGRGPMKSSAPTLIRGSDRVRLIADLERRDDEALIEKPRASAFFNTNLLSILVSKKIDTVVVTGCSTSGCIRSTCESALDYG